MEPILDDFFGSIHWPAHLGRVVTPIFQEVSAGALTFCGSAVLLSGPQDTHWLVSAAHVLAELDHSQLAVAANGGSYFYVVVKGKVISTCELTPENAANDGKDLAFVQLHPVTVRELQREFHFLPLSAVDHVRQTPVPMLCVLNGYPGQYATMEDGRPVKLIELRTKSFLLPDAEVKRRQKLCPAVHLVAPFQRMRDDAGQTMKVPDPAGMSGGAIWTQAGDEFLLTGIIIEHDRHRKEIVGTRVSRLAEEIGRRSV
jgi:hypothetical protein